MTYNTKKGLTSALGAVALGGAMLLGGCSDRRIDVNYVDAHFNIQTPGDYEFIVNTADPKKLALLDTKVEGTEYTVKQQILLLALADSDRTLDGLLRANKDIGRDYSRANRDADDALEDYFKAKRKTTREVADYSREIGYGIGTVVDIHNDGSKITERNTRKVSRDIHDIIDAKGEVDYRNDLEGLRADQSGNAMHAVNSIYDELAVSTDLIVQAYADNQKFVALLRSEGIPAKSYAETASSRDHANALRAIIRSKVDGVTISTVRISRGR